MDFNLLLGLICFGYLWPGRVGFIEDFKEWIGLGDERKWHSNNDIIDYIYKFIHKLMNCYCIVFWIGFILSGSLIFGLLAYVGAEMLTYIMTILENKIIKKNY